MSAFWDASITFSLPLDLDTTSHISTSLVESVVSKSDIAYFWLGVMTEIARLDIPINTPPG